MLPERVSPEHTSPFLRYLATQFQDGERLPSLAVISQELGISLAALREQLEVARALGLVEVRPRTGIRRLPYQFHPAVMQSLGYATTVDGNNFRLFAELRTKLEAAYWYQAVRMLTPADHNICPGCSNRRTRNCAACHPRSPTPNIVNCICRSTGG